MESRQNTNYLAWNTGGGGGEKNKKDVFNNEMSDEREIKYCSNK